MISATITGATGLVGRALVAALDTPVCLLSRNPKRATAALGANVWALDWDGRATPNAAAFADRNVVFHLAGEPIASGRWTAERKRRIYDSRVLGTRAVVDALIALESPPSTLVTASAVGIYGDRGDEMLREASAPGSDFLAEVCQAWEREAARAQAHGVRVVQARLGIVLASNGGALERMLLPFRLGVGGPLGDGSQWMPWVHLDDVVGLLLHAARDSSISGPINVVAPQAVTNREFSRTLARVMHRPSWLAAPRFAVRLALGEVAEAVFASQRVVPAVATDSGYAFRFADLEAALRACVQRD